MNKTRFVVDSAQILIIDPSFVEAFASHFSFKDYVNFRREGKNPQEYIDKVVAEAFPGVKMPLVGLLRADGLYGDTEFVGDGIYEISSKAVKMTPEYEQVLLSWLTKEVA